MSNTCFTTYKAVPEDPAQTRELFDIMRRTANLPEPLEPNTFHTQQRWLGCLTAALGYNWEDYFTRGCWYDEQLADDGVLTFRTETAWERMADVEKILRKRFPGMSLYFLEECCDDGIYDTNDAEGRFFSERVVLDIDEDGMHYLTVQEALEKVGELLGRPVNSQQEAMELIDEYNEEAELEIRYHTIDVLTDEPPQGKEQNQLQKQKTWNSTSSRRKTSMNLNHSRVTPQSSLR